MRRLMALALGLFLAVITGAAHADEAQAEALFRQGLAAIDAGDIATACARFAESQKQDASAGTLLSLADCHARQGKTASAWAEFQQAAVLARHGRPEHHTEALRRATELERLISYLTVAVEKPVPGLEISLGAIPIGEGAYGVRLPVDPGLWHLTASAPGYEPWSRDLRIGSERDDQTVTVPALRQSVALRQDKPPSPEKRFTTMPQAASHRARSSGRSRTPAFIVGGAGAALTVAGAALGVLAIQTYDRAHDACPLRVNCSDSTLHQRSSAELQANLSNAGLALGVVGLAVGTVLFVRSAPLPEERTRTSLTIEVLGPSAKVGVGGAFW